MKNIFKLFLFSLTSFVVAQSNGGGKRFKMEVKNAPEGSVRSFEVTRTEETIGNIKSTTVEFMFENQTDRILEGEFSFALEDGENVVGYALDVNGKMRQGVVVEKEKARTVFEAEVRKGVDPGFVEKTVGNNFKTRVYPIPSRGIRKIQITFEKELSANEFAAIDSDSIGKIFTQTLGTDTYFYFYENASLPPAAKEKKSSIAVFFDVSSSAKNRNIAKEIEFLKKYSEELGKPKISVTAFANDIVGTLDATDDFSKVESFIKKQDFDGATNLNIDFSKFASSEILLFTDGIDNWGNFTNPKNVCVSTVNSSSSANFSNLRKIANENNGIFVNLNELDAKNAVAKMQENPLRVLSVEADANAISDVYPRKGTVVENGFSVAGILKKKSGTVKITLGRNGKAEKVVEKKISAVDSADSPKIARLWATKKIDELETDKESNRAEILETAKKFSVVTEETSLIVLETALQYAQHGIVPPDELKAEYDKIVSRMNQGKADDGGKNGIPEIIYTRFEEFKKWWKKTPKDFEKEIQDAEKKKKQSKGRSWFGLSKAKTATASARASERNADESVVYETEDIQEAEVRMEDVLEEREALPVDSLVMSKIAGRNAVPASAEMREKSKSEAQAAAQSANGNGGTIALKAWTSDAKYLSILKKTATDKMYAKYIELKKEYGASPSFFIEVSDYFAEEDLKAESERILSNLAEMNLENTDILRALGYKLVEREKYSLAIPIFERLTKIRAEIPQFRRDLALACNLAGEKKKAVDNLWFVASRQWDRRYDEIQQICLNDMNAIIATSIVDSSEVDSKLRYNFDCDIRIVLTWNTDDCDVDLWVTDPDGEKCYYGHKNTRIGGRMSRDFTQGYGPEEFCIRNAKPGTYKIEANYFGNHQQKLLQPVTVQAEVYTNFGRKNQTRKVLTLPLNDVKSTFEVGSVEFGK